MPSTQSAEPHRDRTPVRWHEEASSTTLDPRESAAAPHESADSPSRSLSEIATGHVARAARLLNLPEEIALILGQPKNEITVNFPVKMDRGSYRLYADCGIWP